MIYLDAHATTPVDPRVLEAMLPYFGVEFANADSLHLPGQRARVAVERARGQIAELLSCQDRELIFTSGATEANNLAMKGVMNASPPGSHLIVNAAEHASVLEPALKLRRRGYEVTILPVESDGQVAADELANAMTDRTVLVSVMLANNEIGTLNNLHALGALCREEGVLLHTDAVAALGRLEVNLADLPVDLATFSGHKVYGPKGIGVLFLRKSERRLRLEPLTEGGGQEQRLRSGTLPVPSIVGFGKACELLRQELPGITVQLEQQVIQLQQRLFQELDGLVLNGPTQQRLPGNLNLSVSGVDGAALLAALEPDLAVSSGAACSAANPEPSHVLRAIGVPDSLCRASLRLGLHRFLTSDDIEQAAGVIIREVQRLRSLRRGHEKTQG